MALTWKRLLTETESGGSVPMNIEYTIVKVVRNSADKATVTFGIRFASIGYWTKNSIAAFVPGGGTRRWAFNSSNGATANTIGKWYYANKTSASTTTSETATLTTTITGLAATARSGSFTVGFGWNGYTPTQKFTKSISVSIPSWILPPSGLSCSLSSKTETTVTLTGGATSNGGSAITASGYQYSTNNSNWVAFSNGTTVLSPNTTYWFRYYATNGAGTSYSGSIQVATYQYPYIKSISSNPLTIGNQQSVSLYNPLSRNVTVYMKKDTVDGTLLYNGTTNGTSLTFTPNANTLYNSIPNSKESTAIYYCVYDSKRISTLTGVYKIKGDEIPSFTTSNIKSIIESINTAITGSSSKFIQSHNKLTGIISPMTANNGASPDYYSVSSTGLNPISIDHTGNDVNFVLNNIVSNTINITAVDSRGLTKSVSININLIPYSKPSFSNGVLTRKDGISTFAKLNVNGYYTNWSGLSKTNAINGVKYRYKQNNNTSAWSSWIDIKNISTVVNNSNGTFNIQTNLNEEFANNTEYLIQIQVTDLLETVQSEILILSTANCFVWKDLANKRIGINKKPDCALDVDGEIKGCSIIADSFRGKELSNGSGTPGYMYVCDITTDSQYQNQYITFDVLQRNRTASVKLLFVSSNTAGTMRISNAVKSGNSRLFYTNKNNVFSLYVQKSEAYDNIEICNVQKGKYMTSTKITWKNQTILNENMPSDCKEIESEFAKECKNVVLNTYFPVGSIYMTIDANFNPGTTFGGTWERVANSTYLVGYDANNTYFDRPGNNKGSKEDSGGSWDTHGTSLTVDQLPKHTHGGKTIKGWARFRDVNTSAHDISVGEDGVVMSLNNSVTWSGSHSALAVVSKSTYKYNQMNINASHEHAAVGLGEAHSHFHVQPYYIVCVWKRTA